MGQKVIVEKVQLNKIKLARNSRLNVKKEELAGLMQSIKEIGLLQPIGVVKRPGGTFEVCYGNRRFMACSKLGFSHIPAVVHEEKKESDVDIKNLTENIQRRQINLTEAGRYIDLLNRQGLTNKEISIRLGVTSGYVGDCLRAFQEVPVELQSKLEVRAHGGSKLNAPGTFSIKTANAITSARRRFRLDKQQTKDLFELAPEAKFVPENVSQYAMAIKEGVKGKKVFDVVEPIRYVQANIGISQKEHDRLYEKYVAKGPFKGLGALLRAILEGKVHEKVRVARDG
jgi:ParB/RepB/Spo0J family partition protein